MPSNLAVLSSRIFSGPIKSGTQYISVLGSEDINIRKVDLKKRQTVLNVVTILGECAIFVEPGIRVTIKAVPILGDAKMNHKVAKLARMEDPELIVSGTVLLGNISVKLIKD
jgi:hypothetical protein